MSLDEDHTNATAKMAAEAVLDTVTAHNDLASPFLRLPAELRNQIYEYILTSSAPLRFVRHKSPRTKNSRSQPRGIKLSESAPSGLAVIAVCRKTYQEAKLLPFILNTIHCTSLPVLEKMGTCLSLDQRRCIKELRLFVDAENAYTITRLLSSKTPRLSTILPNVRSVKVTLRTVHDWRPETIIQMVDNVKVFLQGEEIEEIQRVYERWGIPEVWKPIQPTIATSAPPPESPGRVSPDP